MEKEINYTDNAPIMKIKNLSKSYHTLPVLKDISLDVQRGEVIAIIGPSGSEKVLYFVV